MKDILKNAKIVDVRTREEFESGHYPGAINIPVQELPERLDEFSAVNQPIVAYCRSGGRSEMAVAILRQSGLGRVYNGGGLADMYNI